jgi:cell division septum initiation protein DivIVA
MSAEKPANTGSPHIDLDEVARLIEALEGDLQKFQGSSREIQHLRDEIETLKNVLNSPVRRHHWVSDALHGIRQRIHGSLDAATLQGIEVGRYIAEIGRILGM